MNHRWNFDAVWANPEALLAGLAGGAGLAGLKFAFAALAVLLRSEGIWPTAPLYVYPTVGCCVD